MSQYEINEWQWLDKNSICYPWYTYGFLNMLGSWNTKHWNVLEWGSGYSTIWWAKNCSYLVSIEDNINWAKIVAERLKDHQINNIDFKIITRDTDSPDPNISHPYINYIDSLDIAFDCIIVDGTFRNACIKKALSKIKLGGIIILDNADYVDLQPSHDLLKHNVRHSYPQDGHPHWRTDYWEITTKEAVAMTAEEASIKQRLKRK